MTHFGLPGTTPGADYNELLVENERHRDNSVWAADRIKALEAEIERLRKDWDNLATLAAERTDEIERLRAWLKRIAQSHANAGWLRDDAALALSDNDAWPT